MEFSERAKHRTPGGTAYEKGNITRTEQIRGCLSNLKGAYAGAERGRRRRRPTLPHQVEVSDDALTQKKKWGRENEQKWRNEKIHLKNPCWSETTTRKSEPFLQEHQMQNEPKNIILRAGLKFMMIYIYTSNPAQSRTTSSISLRPCSCDTAVEDVPKCRNVHATSSHNSSTSSYSKPKQQARWSANTPANLGVNIGRVTCVFWDGFVPFT